MAVPFFMFPPSCSCLNVSTPNRDATRPPAGGEGARRRRWKAYFVHVYTASGVLFAFLAAVEISRVQPDPRWVFLWLAAAGLIDATDGPLARRFEVKRYAPALSGRTIDDLVDYLTFTFLPLLLVARMDWAPGPALVWIGPALVASLLGFAHTGAKEEADGFFRGFPSYWNLVAFYVGLVAQPPYAPAGPWLSAGVLVALAALTVLPVRFLYPNLAPEPWRRPVLWGAYAWIALLAALLPWYPALPPWLMLLSLVYPVFYVALSVYLDRRTRRGH